MRNLLISFQLFKRMAAFSYTAELFGVSKDLGARAKLYLSYEALP